MYAGVVAKYSIKVSSAALLNYTRAENDMENLTLIELDLIRKTVQEKMIDLHMKGDHDGWQQHKTLDSKLARLEFRAQYGSDK